MAMKQKHQFIIFAILILAIALLFRFTSMDLKAMHHDEGVNYYFSKMLNDSFHYQYNPDAYHGPFLYFAGYPAYALAGPSKFSLRFTPALFGMVAILFFILMRNVIGKPGAILGALILAISPADIYFSKTFIHEIYLSAFSIGFLWSFLEYSRQPRVRFLFGFFVFASLAFTVKETTAVMGVALFGAYFTTRFILSWFKKPEKEMDPCKINWKEIRRQKIFLADAFGVGLAIWVLLFSSFLTYPQGITKFFVAYAPWLETGFTHESGHEKELLYFVTLLIKYYAPVILPAIATGVWAFIKRNPRGLFLTLYSLFLLLIYSVIPYKTPWCVMQIGIPFMALAAFGLSKVLERKNTSPMTRLHVLIIMLIFLVPYTYYSYAINFIEYDNDKHEIIYVQTERAYEDMFELIEKIAKNSGMNENLTIAEVKAKYPSFFYLRNYVNVVNYGDGPEDIVKEKVLLVALDNWKENDVYLKNTMEKLPCEYLEVNTYPVWPGTFIALLVEKKFYSKYARETP